MTTITQAAKTIYVAQYEANLPPDTVALLDRLECLDLDHDAYIACLLAGFDALHVSKGEENAIFDAIMETSERA